MTASMDETPAANDALRVRSLALKDAEVTDLDKVRAAAARRRAAARTRDLTALLRDRPDLADVHAPADFAGELASLVRLRPRPQDRAGGCSLGRTKRQERRPMLCP